MNKEEIISGMELIMHIASFYSHPNVQMLMIGMLYIQ